MENKNKKKYMKKYHKLHKKEIAKYWKEYYQKHKEERKKYRNKYYQEHRQKLIEYSRKYKKNHKKEQQKLDKKRWLKNRTKRIRQHIIRTKIRYNNDINFRLICCLRNRLCLALKGNPKLSTTMKLVGCSIQQLKKHLESKFKLGMSWSNYGKWHIDHIKPCASFDLSKASEQKKCFNYKNLQPLWGKENLKKGNK